MQPQGIVSTISRKAINDFKTFLNLLTKYDKHHHPDPIVFLQPLPEVQDIKTGAFPPVLDYFPMAMSAIDKAYSILSDYNTNGYGIHVGLHEFGRDGDVKGGKVGENCSRVRCFVVDVDKEIDVEVLEWLVEALSPTFVVISSKKGEKFKCHIYWMIGEVGLELEEHWKLLQKALAYRVEDILFQKFKIKKPSTDRAISNLAKTLRLPGFLHQKDISNPFISKLIVVDEDRVIDDVENFKEFFSYLNINKEYLEDVRLKEKNEKVQRRRKFRAEREEMRTTFGEEEKEVNNFDPEDDEALEGYFGAEKGGRNSALLEYVTRLIFVKQLTQEEAYGAALYVNEKYNLPPLEDLEVEKIVESCYENYLEKMTDSYRERVERGDSFATRHLLMESTKKILSNGHDAGGEEGFSYDYSNKNYFQSLTSDTSIAARVLQKFGNDIAIHPEGELMVYQEDYGLWGIGDSFAYSKIRDVCSDVVSDNGITQIFCDKKGNFKEEKFETFKEKLFSTRKSIDCIKLIKTSSRIALDIEKINADPFLLHAKNGVIDIRTGIVNHHDKKYLMTYSLGYSVQEDLDIIQFYKRLKNRGSYLESKNSNLWLKFIYEIMGGDIEMCRYLQKIMGYALSGNNPHELIFFLYGTGANGKSIFIETALQLLGKYSFAVPVSIFLNNTRENKSTIIAQLPGKRLISTSEVGRDREWDEEVIKNMGGADKVNARQIFTKSMDYRPGFKTFVRGNHKPVIKGTDHGIWRKIRLVPFDVTIPEEKRDIQLREKLFKAELMQEILMWAIAGYQLYLEEGLKVPKIAQKATEEYRHESNPIGAFMEECLDSTEIEEEFLTLYQILEGYNNVWRKELGHDRLTAIGLSKILSAQGYRPLRKRMDGVRTSFFNFKFKDDGSDMQKEIQKSIKNKVIKIY